VCLFWTSWCCCGLLFRPSGFDWVRLCCLAVGWSYDVCGLALWAYVGLVSVYNICFFAAVAACVVAGLLLLLSAADAGCFFSSQVDFFGSLVFAVVVFSCAAVNVFCAVLWWVWLSWC
jgi:hypothetical protein